MSVPERKRVADAAAPGRRRIVAVIGSGETADPQCEGLGGLIAGLGCDLLTGAGRGSMEAVSRAYFETSPRAGVVVGIVPGTVHPLHAIENRWEEPVRFDLPPGYPNPWVEIAIYTHLPDSGPEGTLRSSRNHVNVLSADAIVALPGGAGTDSEMWLATRYGVPVIAFGEHAAPAPYGIELARTLNEVRAFLVAKMATRP